MLVYGVTHNGRHARHLRKLRIAPCAEKSYQAKDEEERESKRRVTPCTAKGSRKFAREEVAKALAALRVCLIDTPMRANHKAVQIIYESRVSALCARNRKVRSCATIDAPKLSHLLAVQTAQTGTIKQHQQIFQPLPCVLALCDESV